jgi:hypothetical protein
MNLVSFLVLVALFVLLTPGVLLRLPKNGSKMTVAVVHGLVFALVWSLSHRFLTRATSMFNIDIGGSYMEALEGAKAEEKKDEKKGMLDMIPGLSSK